MGPSTLTTLQTGEVKLRFTPGSLLGAVTASLTLATNDPDTPSFEILLAASVPLAPLEFYPITSVTSSTEGDDLYVVANLIQGLGSGFSSNFPHDQLGGGSTHRWVTTACGYPCDYLGSLPPPVIILDLGENRALQEINVWGYTGANDNGVKEFQLRFATAAEGIDNFGKSITYNPTFLIENKNDLPRLPFPFQFQAQHPVQLLIPGAEKQQGHIQNRPDLPAQPLEKMKFAEEQDCLLPPNAQICRLREID